MTLGSDDLINIPACKANLLHSEGCSYDGATHEGDIGERAGGVATHPRARRAQTHSNEDYVRAVACGYSTCMQNNCTHISQDPCRLSRWTAASTWNLTWVNVGPSSRCLQQVLPTQWWLKGQTGFSSLTLNTAASLLCGLHIFYVVLQELVEFLHSASDRREPGRCAFSTWLLSLFRISTSGLPLPRIGCELAMMPPCMTLSAYISSDLLSVNRCPWARQLMQWADRWRATDWWSCCDGAERVGSICAQCTQPIYCCISKHINLKFFI